jgi:hypothetical protein
VPLNSSAVNLNVGVQLDAARFFLAPKSSCTPALLGVSYPFQKTIIGPLRGVCEALT